MEKYLCFRCKHELIISSNWMGSDIGAIEEDKALTDEDFMITSMSCPYCGAGYEVYDTPESEMCHYPYFNEDNSKTNIV